MKLHYNGMVIEGTPEECVAFMRMVEPKAEGQPGPVVIPYFPYPWDTVRPYPGEPGWQFTCGITCEDKPSEYQVIV